jgi:hypothetical protein
VISLMSSCSHDEPVFSNSELVISHGASRYRSSHCICFHSQLIDVLCCIGGVRLENDWVFGMNSMELVLS